MFIMMNTAGPHSDAEQLLLLDARNTSLHDNLLEVSAKRRFLLSTLSFYSCSLLASKSKKRAGISNHEK